MYALKKENQPVWGPENFRFQNVTYNPEFMRERRKYLYIVTDSTSLFHPDVIKACDGIVHSLDDFTSEKIKDTAFYIYFNRAEWALPALERIIKCGGIFAPPSFFNRAPFYLVSGKALESYNEAGTLLGYEPFGDIDCGSQLCQVAELTRDVQGDFVEVGVFTGSSALISLTHMRNLGVSRSCWLLDTYAGFNYETAKESPDAIWFGTHSANKDEAIQRMRNLMAKTEQDVHVVPADICTDELPSEIKSIAFANIDVDMYEAISKSVRKVGMRMAVRGIMIVEDPVCLPALYGAYLALTEFLKTDLGRKFIPVRTHTQYLLIRVEP